MKGTEMKKIGDGDHHVLCLHGWFGSADGWGFWPDVADTSSYTWWFPDMRAAGYWLVREPDGPGLRHADVDRVLKDPATFSSSLGGTQMRDPRTAEDLAYVRRMMLNMDPPEHSRLRRLLAKSFTPKAIGALEGQVRGHVDGIVDRMLDGGSQGAALGASHGACDFAKDVSADLPLLTLADVMGVPPQDRWLMFDWANRVIGWQDPDYRVSASFDPASGDRTGAGGIRAAPRARAGRAHARPAQPGRDARPLRLRPRPRHSATRTSPART
jgi:cytochrome P450